MMRSILRRFLESSSKDVRVVSGHYIRRKIVDGIDIFLVSPRSASMYGWPLLPSGLLEYGRVECMKLKVEKPGTRSTPL